jgi:hypothetical protein
MNLITKLLKNPDHKKIEHNIRNMTNSIGPMPFVVQNEVIEPQDPYECPPLIAGSFNKWQYT